MKIEKNLRNFANQLSEKSILKKAEKIKGGYQDEPCPGAMRPSDECVRLDGEDPVAAPGAPSSPDGGPTATGGRGGGGNGGGAGSGSAV